jgi:2-dehydropantoate 2-reductase
MATKAVDLHKAAQEIVPIMNEDSLAVCMKNGICEPALAEVLGRGRVVGCIVGWGATFHRPGELEITASGKMILGSIFEPADERLPAVADILRAVYPVRISHNMMGHRYAKLVINCCIASLGVVCGLPLGQMLSMSKARNIMIAVIKECMAVADAMGVKVEPFFGRLDYHSFVNGSGWCSDAKRHMLLRLVGFRYRRLRSSSHTSLMRGRQTEIDYLNGYVAQKGRECGIATPVNDAVIAVVKEIEKGDRTVSIHNFNDGRFSGL